MKVKQVMTDHLESIRPEDTLQHAAEKMKQFNVGALAVVRDGQLIGMLTDRDLVVRALAEGRSPTNTPVEQAMSGDVICCHDDQDIREAAGLMQERKLRRLPVVNKQNKPVGILSLGDLAVHANPRLAGGVLQEVAVTHH